MEKAQNAVSPLCCIFTTLSGCSSCVFGNFSSVHLRKLVIWFSVPPKILSSSPQSFHQPLGTTARIYCRAEGSPKPQASWTKDGKTLRISSRVTIQNEGTEVIINNLQKQDGGIYKCTFRNAVGLISQTVHLIVEGIIACRWVLCNVDVM